MEDQQLRLSPKQKRFIEEYTVDWNATQAAIRSGYSVSSAASIGAENLIKPNISKAISERVSKLTMSADEALMRMSDFARGSFEPFLIIDEESNIKVNLTSEAAQRNIKLIRKIKQTRTIIDEVEQISMEIELHDAKDAVAKVLQLNGKLIDRNVNIKSKLEGATPEQLDAIVDAVLSKSQE